MIKTQTKTGTAERVIRTGIQAIVGGLIADSGIVPLLHITSQQETAVVVAASVFATSWIQNYTEGKGWLPAILRQAEQQINGRPVGGFLKPGPSYVNEVETEPEATEDLEPKPDLNFTTIFKSKAD